MRNPFQAVKDKSYPVIPAFWPNRAVRRAKARGRPLPQARAEFFRINPKFKVA